MIDRRAATPAALALFAAALVSPAAAQNAQDVPAPPRGLESLTPQAVPVPPAPVIVLPEQTPAPRPSPTARTTPRTRQTDESRQAPASRPAPTPEASPTPRAGVPTPTLSSTPEAVPESTPAAAPALTPTPVPAATPAPSPPQAEPTLAAPESGRTMPIWLLPAVIVAVLAGLWALTRRRGARPEPFAEPDPVEIVPEPVAPAIPTPVAPAPVAAPAPEPTAPSFLVPTPPAAPRARLAVELRPLRAGLNLLSAVVECELVVTNTGDAPAEGIRTGVTLLTAHAALDADLAALTAAPIGRPSTPPFALAPGETRTVRAIAAAPRDAIQTMTAANRPMFVPIVSVNLLYRAGDMGAQTTRAWAVGIERVDSAKLAPFWFDAPPKMYDAVAARPHAAAFER
jgi:hypothetical protein